MPLKFHDFIHNTPHPKVSINYTIYPSYLPPNFQLITQYTPLQYKALQVHTHTWLLHMDIKLITKMILQGTPKGIRS